MTAFGSPTGAVPVGGSGQFDGVMLLGFTKPRIEGTFTGDRMRAWDTVWGHGTAKVVIENGYAIVSESVITDGRSEIKTDGTFSLGYPRRDHGEEINARVFITRRPLKDLRHAFELDDYPVEGSVSGEYHLYGKYETPFGFGGSSSTFLGASLRRGRSTPPARRCASRDPASGWTALKSTKVPAA